MSITYLDTSALLKLYVQESHSADVNRLVTSSAGTGTSILTYAEMAAALARAQRMGILSGESAKAAWGNFLHDWPGITRLKVAASLTGRAASLAWEFGLRGYDAMHLSTALTWQDALEEPVLLATFDRLLWGAGKKAGIAIWPEELVTE
jgi:predicted nucleic acid-binding protein